jgi:hypothetical protein
LLFCFHYDAGAGKYGPAARQMMKLFGGLTLAALLIGMVPFWLRRRQRPRGAQVNWPVVRDGADPDRMSLATTGEERSKSEI